MTTKKDADTKDEAKEDGADGAGDGKSSDSATTGGDGLDASIRKLVADAVDALLGDRDTGKRPGTLKSDEDAMFKMVKEAQVKLKAEEEKDHRFTQVAETVEKLAAATEKPPARSGIGGKLEKWLWGERA